MLQWGVICIPVKPKTIILSHWSGTQPSIVKRNFKLTVKCCEFIKKYMDKVP